MPRIALIHATPLAIESINQAFARLWPDAHVTNLLDDSLAPDLAREGRLTDAMINRFITLARYTRASGADAILYTCSAFGPAIEAARAALDVPVLKPNEAMFDEALNAGNRIGLMATFGPSIPALRKELEDLAEAREVKLSVRTEAVPAALTALQAARTDDHDSLIADAADTMTDCDVIVLGQFSMASAAPVIEARGGNRRVLTSPDSAVRRLKSLMPAH